MPDRMPEDMSNHYMPPNMSDRMPDRMPEDMSRIECQKTMPE